MWLYNTVNGFLLPKASTNNALLISRMLSNKRGRDCVSGHSGRYTLNGMANTRSFPEIVTRTTPRTMHGPDASADRVIRTNGPAVSLLSYACNCTLSDGGPS